MTDIFLTDKDMATLQALIAEKASTAALNALAGIVNTKASTQQLTNMAKSLAATINTSINSLSHFQVVSYVGTGDLYYADKFKTVIPFDIKPEVVIVLERGTPRVDGDDGTRVKYFFYGYRGGSESTEHIYAEWTENTLRIYSTNLPASLQCNTAGVTYYAIAFEMKPEGAFEQKGEYE